MSEEGDTFWVSLAERLFGLSLIIIGAVLLYFTVTSSSGPDSLGPFSILFGALSVILVLLGIFLLLVKPPE
jgi:ABC-type tungstate transport system substrate-binding protein